MKSISLMFTKDYNSFMSGYSGEPEKMLPNWRPCPDNTFGHKDSFITRKLHEDKINDPTSKRRAVERLADLAANEHSVEAAANLALFMGLDLNDYVLREGIINRINEVDGAQELQDQLKERAKKCEESGDIIGFTALAAIVGYYPPETIHKD